MCEAAQAAGEMICSFVSYSLLLLLSPCFDRSFHPPASPATSRAAVACAVESSGDRVQEDFSGLFPLGCSPQPRAAWDFLQRWQEGSGTTDDVQLFRV